MSVIIMGRKMAETVVGPITFTGVKYQVGTTLVSGGEQKCSQKVIREK